MISEVPLGFLSEADRARAEQMMIGLSPEDDDFHQIVESFTELDFHSTIAPLDSEDWGDFTSPYLGFRLIRSFTMAELAKISSVLPSEGVLLKALNGRPIEHPYMLSNLMKKTAIKMLCDDFPHLEALCYSDEMKRVDNFLEKAKMMETLPYVDFMDWKVTSRTSKVKADTMPWWEIGLRKVQFINGVPLKTATRNYMRGPSTWHLV